MSTYTITVGKPRFWIDGVEYVGLDAVPPEHRAMCEATNAACRRIMDRALHHTEDHSRRLDELIRKSTRGERK